MIFNSYVSEVASDGFWRIEILMMSHSLASGGLFLISGIGGGSIRACTENSSCSYARWSCGTVGWASHIVTLKSGVRV